MGPWNFVVLWKIKLSAAMPAYCGKTAGSIPPSRKRNERKSFELKVRELSLSWMQPIADLQSSLPREIWVSCHRTQKSYEKIASPKCSECIRSVIWEYFDVVLVQTFIFTWANNLWTEICAPTIHYSQQLFLNSVTRKWWFSLMRTFSDQGRSSLGTRT